MIDLRSLPDAIKILEGLDFGAEDNKDQLYEIYYKISMAIFNYRLKHNLSQTKLAKQLGVTQAMVSKLESGDYNYTIEQLWKIANKLGFKFDVVFEDNNQEYSVGYSSVEDRMQLVNYSIYDLAVGS